MDGLTDNGYGKKLVTRDVGRSRCELDCTHSSGSMTCHKPNGCLWATSCHPPLIGRCGRRIADDHTEELLL